LGATGRSREAAVFNVPRALGLLGCALSGAGPSILVFFEREYESVCDLVRQIFRLHGHESETLFTGIAEHGFEVTDERE
jgi:homoserine kinase